MFLDDPVDQPMPSAPADDQATEATPAADEAAGEATPAV
jgi:hypothetical protein